ncbi:cytochrome b-c1 complex subunit 1, mitochondrial-like [Hyposmocoma kahamanoa]|uniref:cytochrome b-c1 complex subunit 1, mitochondrial-like n=1 Tax=Hyposmocoma kahamanoa TaxID=1477025 RepID=UPI000E6D760F|nr:cytochrome b-c1 complex subunit 1, mitochondrial-like [Hyposmocoma kahamanoa]
MFENGIAHFFQHIVYKGTRNRSKQALEAQMTCTGAQFKAFTEKELVGYYAECLLEDLPLIVDILSDCIFQNALNPFEIEVAKSVAYLEMMDHDEDTNEILMDYLHGAAFHGTPLAQSVLGPSTNLYNFTEATIAQYMRQNFDPTRTVLVAVGGATHQCVHDLGALYLNHLQPAKCADYVYRFSCGDFRYRNDDLPFANVAIAFEAPNFCHSDAYVLDMATTFIGGWDASMPRGNLPAPMCARAAATGMADAYKSFYFKYKDTGLWGIQYTAPKLHADDFLYNLQQQCVKLCLSLTRVELERARNEYITSLVTELDTLPGACKDLARWFLFYGQRPSTLDRVTEYQFVKLDRVRELCEELIYDRSPVVAAVGNIEVVPDYTRIKASNYWLRV